MKIAIVHPTRSRPEKVLETARLWLRGYQPTPGVYLEYCLGVELTEVGLYADTILALQEEFGDQFKTRFLGGKRFTVDMFQDPTFSKYSESSTQVAHWLTAISKGNVLIKESKADWFVAIADDLHPCVDWNLQMQPTFERLLGQVAVVGYQNELSRMMVSHPVCTREFFRWNNNSLMCLEYIHTHADVDLWLEATGAGVLHTFPPEITLRHVHPLLDASVKWDDLNTLNNHTAIYAQGAAVFKRRVAELEQKYERVFNLANRTFERSA